jgi:hypothetical protein
MFLSSCHESDTAMATLTKASEELFRRSPDERFETLDALYRHCREEKRASEDRWHLPQKVQLRSLADAVGLALSDDGEYRLNDWSFSQLCKLAGVGKETVNRLSPDTASRVLMETLPAGRKPLQILTKEDQVRAIHAASYTRLHNADLVQLVQETATSFTPPQQGMNGATGLYCGEQDLFAFLIDPTGWTEIEGEAFAPGFFVWNSEVGRRSVGIQTFWFQAVCQNHIVWDATEVVDFSRKHTANVHDALAEIRHAIDALVAKRDSRRDGFYAVMKKAMQQRLGDDAEAVLQKLAAHGISRSLAKRATEIAAAQGRFTIFSLVDALTRLTGRVQWIGERTEADEKVASLLALAL